MGRKMLWIQILQVFLVLDSTNGLQCLSCRNVFRITECHNVTTCAEGSRCYKKETSAIGKYLDSELGCKNTSNCPLQPAYSGGFLAESTLCCENEPLCNFKLSIPTYATPPTVATITHLDPPFIAGNTFLELHSNEYFYCWYNASKVLSITWLFNGSSTLPPHVSHSSGSLVLYIKSMTRSEVGNYTCIISIDGVEAKTSVWIYLIEANTPIGLPKVTANRLITNGKMVLNFKSDASLHCASERNDVTYTWQFNGTSVLPQHARLTDSTINIENVNVTEVGKYTCIISKNGYASASSVWVSIKEEKAHVSSITYFPAYRPMVNEQLNIFCNVTGFPDPTIRWNFKDPMGLYYVPPDMKFPRHDLIRVEHFEPSLHSGTWTCMVRNSLGADQKSIDI